MFIKDKSQMVTMTALTNQHHGAIAFYKDLLELNLMAKLEEYYQKLENSKVLFNFRTDFFSHL